MRKKIFLSAIMISTFLSINVLAEERSEKEILFRDIPWGITYAEACDLMPEFDWYTMYFYMMKTYSVDEIIYGDYEGIDFENSGINMTAIPFYNKETSVAGYTTSNIDLYFSFPVINGIMAQDENNSIFYGARYEFEPENTDDMYDDLKTKLSSLYGNPIKEYSEADYLDIETTITVWEGANNTYVSLYADDVFDEVELWPDSLYISYAWGEGDAFLQAASDAVSAQAIEEESSIYGNDDLGGL